MRRPFVTSGEPDMTTADAAEALGLTTDRLRQLHRLGIGPDRVDTPQGPRYRLGDLGDWYYRRGWIDEVAV